MEKNNNTHAMTTPNQRAPMTVENFRQTLAKQYMKQLTNYLGGDQKRSLKFLSAAVYSLERVPKLLECDPGTLIQSFMSCAEFELYPSNVAGEAFIIPYKGRAQFQLGYQGLITLLSRAGINVNSQIVRKNDTFRYEEGLNPVLEHKWDAFSSEQSRGEPVGVYAVLTNSIGQKVISMLSREKVMAFKNLSQAKDSQYSPWNSSQDPELWMWRKTAIKQAAKLVPKTEVLQKAIAEDNEESVVSAHRNALNAGGPATGTANHKPDDVTVVPDSEVELQNALDKEQKDGNE